MSKPPNNVTKLSSTLTLSEFTDPKNGSFGFWLYDETRGMNLAVQSPSAQAALLKALAYYQNQLERIERMHAELTKSVEDFFSQVSE